MVTTQLTTDRITAAQLFQQIQDFSKKHSRPADSLQVIPNLVLGDSIPQGDLNFTLLPSVPSCAIAIESPELQLAPGKTKGSRHCLNSLENVKIYRLPNPLPIQGPILEFLGETIITHPEHEDQLWRTGVVIVSYQRQLAEDIVAIVD